MFVITLSHRYSLVLIQLLLVHTRCLHMGLLRTNISMKSCERPARRRNVREDRIENIEKVMPCYRVLLELKHREVRRMMNCPSVTRSTARRSIVLVSMRPRLIRASVGYLRIILTKRDLMVPNLKKSDIKQWLLRRCLR